MLKLNNIFPNNNSTQTDQPTLLEQKLYNNDIPFDEFLNDPEVILTVKNMDPNTKKYLTKDKIIQLIKYITREPKNDDILKSRKYPYIAYEILSSDNEYIKNEIRSQFNEKYEDIFVIDCIEENKTLTQSLTMSIKNVIQKFDISSYIEKDELKINDENNNYNNIINICNENIENKEKKINLKEIKHESIQETNNINNENENFQKILSKDDKNINYIINDRILDKDKIIQNKDNIENNIYIDLLLNFVMNEKSELNNVLSGYFFEVMIVLLYSFPYEILKYLYTKRRHALKKIVFHSKNGSLSELSIHLLKIETITKFHKYCQKGLNQLFPQIVDYRNDIIKELINSINIEGDDIEEILKLILNLADNDNIIKILMSEGYLSPHFFDILNIDLFAGENKDNFNIKYSRYCLFLNFISLLIKILDKKKIRYPYKETFDLRILKKNAKDLDFNDNMILSLYKILKNNFKQKDSHNLGYLNTLILELIKNMFYFMKNGLCLFDYILEKTDFCKKSFQFFFEYQKSDIYNNAYLTFFKKYLYKADYFTSVTKTFFEEMKIHELLISYVEKNSNKNRKVKKGIYPFAIDLIYKIQTYSGLNIFNEEDIINYLIEHLGDFNFVANNKDYKYYIKINTSKTLNNILSNNSKWCSIFDDIVKLEIIKYYKFLYDGKLTPKKGNKKDAHNKNNDYDDDLIDFFINLYKDKRNNNNHNNDKKDKNKYNYKKFNDVNYWKIKNELPENIKNKIEINSNNKINQEISEEDELLNIAMKSDSNLNKKNIEYKIEKKSINEMNKMINKVPDISYNEIDNNYLFYIYFFMIMYCLSILIYCLYFNY